jgi:pimeloyl-ACP methyl ester carboxylesterase
MRKRFVCLVLTALLVALSFSAQAQQQAKAPKIGLQVAHIPGAQFIVLPEAAHSINWEQPESFNRNVLEFIRRH